MISERAPAPPPAVSASKPVYLLLSAFSGFLEIGVLVFAIREGWSVVALPAIALAYQAGALFVDPLPLHRGAYLIAAAGAVVLALSSRPLPYPLILAIVVLLAVSTQGARSMVASGVAVSTLLKRLSRICGFVAAGAFTHAAVFPTCCAGLLLVAVSLLINRRNQKAWTRLPFSPEAGLMVIHQAHYFCYSALVPILLYRAANLRPAAVGPLFALGWLSYTLAPSLLKRWRPPRVFVVGHLFAAAVLTCLAAFSERPMLTVFLWFLTGFGGGTVFVLRLREKAESKSLRLDAWENIGHVFGLALGAILVYCLHMEAALLAAEAVACGTAALMVLHAHKHNML